MLAFISGISPIGILVILVLALLFFGNRLPEVARSVGKAMTEFKKGLREVDEDPPAEPRRKLDPPKEQVGGEPTASTEHEADPVARTDQSRD